MASAEQKGLAEDVKSVHRELREQLLKGGEPNEVILISIPGTLYYASLQRFGRNICKIRRLWTSTAKAWNLWQHLIGKKAARRAGWNGSRIRYYPNILVTWPILQTSLGWVGQETGNIQVSLSPFQIVKVSFRSRAIFGLVVKREKRKETRKG